MSVGYIDIRTLYRISIMSRMEYIQIRILSDLGREHGGGGGIMKSEKLKIASVMKYVVFLMIVVFVVLMLLYASAAARPFSEVSEAVAASLIRRI